MIRHVIAIVDDTRQVSPNFTIQNDDDDERHDHHCLPT